ncbi:hypothetical protein HDU98_004466 [Podochytrium sp. JEL0797]|nr:hypothetical protein HDU98_004466 [Podochytrium sp. JEL0797]
MTASPSSPACVQNIALKLTSVYETSSQNLQWDVCVSLPDNHGYSVGIVQFTTGTGSAQAVIAKYEQLLNQSSGSNVTVVSPFKSFDTTLAGLKHASEAAGGAAQGDISGLTGFCDAWKKASASDAFKNAQLAVLGELYWLPSQKAAHSVSLTLPVSVSQIFDSTIQLGLQGTTDLIHQTQQQQKASDDEEKWIASFLSNRHDKLVSMGGAYAPTITRVASYQYIVQQGNYKFVGNKVDALDNDGRVMTVMCDEAVVNGSVGGGMGGAGAGAGGPSLGAPGDGGGLLDASGYRAVARVLVVFAAALFF